MEWNGIEAAAPRANKRNIMKQNRTEWNGMEWNGVEWSGNSVVALLRAQEWNVKEPDGMK